MDPCPLLEPFGWKSYLSVFLFLFLCLLSYAQMTLTRTGLKLLRFPRSPKLPLVGTLPFFITWDPEGFTRRLEMGIRLLGRRYVSWVGQKPYIVIAEAEAVQKVMGSTKHIEKGLDYHKFHWLFGDGLITSNGNLWREDRKLLSPSFKYQRFDGFLHHFNKYSKVLVEILSETFENNDKETNLHPFLCRATMDFISESAMGQASDYQHNINHKFLDAVHMALDAARMEVIRPWLCWPVMRDLFGHAKKIGESTAIFNQMIKDQVDNRREILKTSTHSEDETKPFIDCLLETKSYEEITGHIVTIFGAGFETTASGMNYTLFLLARHPEYQVKVHQELDDLFTDPEKERDVTFSDLAELKYLEMCIKESLRLFPPAPIIFRHASEDIDIGWGQVIPKGVDAVFPIREIHRDPSVFPNPEQFIPERFLPEACAERHPYAYIPFSAGPRNCLGMKYAMVQMKTCLAHILRKFKVETEMKRRNIRMIYGVVLEPKPEIVLRLRPRV